MTPTIEVLASHHDVTHLDSGAPELDEWLAVAARQAQDRDTARVYVICDTNGAVLAYSALVAATIGRDVLPSRAASGLPGFIPAVLLGKLAVAQSQQGAGLGTALLGHAGRTALATRQLIGVRMLFTEARDQAARHWYVSKGWHSARDDRTCYVRLKDLV